jgi:uncharacterized phosphosugar-binding protein/N-acetylglucosamine kinase-like BadF-type ATPase
MSAATRLAVGIDAGQSAIRVQVVGESTPRITSGMSHPASADEFVARVSEVLDGIDGFGRIVVGMTTLPDDDDQRGRLAALLRAQSRADEVWITGDEITAHAGAFRGLPGVMLVVGTGVACVANDPVSAVTTRIDGAGFLIGDEGGAFWLGRHAIRAALAAGEGRGPTTALTELVATRFGTLDGLAARLHAGPDPVDRIAHAALDVVTAAHRGDEVAGRLLDTAADRLAGSVGAAARTLAEPCSVALDGRLLAEGSPLARRLAFRLDATLGADHPVVFRPGAGLLGATSLATGDIDPTPYLRSITTCHRDATTTGPVRRDASNHAATDVLDAAVSVLADVRAHELAAIGAAAELLAATIAAGGLVHVFGTGHSHLLAEEAFYRAGGLAAIDPILVPQLMLHEGAIRSTVWERTPGLVDTILDGVEIAPIDTVIVASNSGGNTVTDELADHCRAAGARVVAIVSRRHAATKATARLVALADVVIDNHGVVGDAAVVVDGLDTRVGPTSTVAGAAIIQALTAAPVQRLVADGIDPGVLRSANTVGGDAHNEAILAPLRPRIRAL